MNAGCQWCCLRWDPRLRLFFFPFQPCRAYQPFRAATLYAEVAETPRVKGPEPGFVPPPAHKSAPILCKLYEWPGFSPLDVPDLDDVRPRSSPAALFFASEPFQVITRPVTQKSCCTRVPTSSSCSPRQRGGAHPRYSCGLATAAPQPARPLAAAHTCLRRWSHWRCAAGTVGSRDTLHTLLFSTALIVVPPLDLSRGSFSGRWGWRGPACRCTWSWTGASPQNFGPDSTVALRPRRWNLELPG